MCHDHTGGPGDDILAADPTAPDLGGFASRQWLTGFLDPERIKTRKFFGNSKFRRGKMPGILDDLFADFEEEDKQDFEKLVIALSAEARLPAQSELDQQDAQTIQQGKELIDAFGCTDCHAFHAKKGDGSATVLTGYGSAEWLEGIIADPAAKQYYGSQNDGMPSYHGSPDSPDRNLLTPDQIKSLAEWLRNE